MTIFYNSIGGLSMGEDGKGSNSDTSQLQCVNPQYTDKRYHCPQESRSSIVSNGFMTPCPPSIDTTSHPSLLLSEITMASCTAGPASASSSSSFDSSPGYASSCSSSVSTEASSRRQSMINHDSHQYYFPDSSPTPAFRRRRPKEPIAVDRYSLQQSLSIDPQGVCPTTAPFSIMSDVVSTAAPSEFLIQVNDFAEREQSALEEYENTLSGLPAYEVLGHNSESTCWSADLVSNFSGYLSTPAESCSETGFESHEPCAFDNNFECQAALPSQSAPAVNPPALEQRFRYHQRRVRDNVSAFEDDEYLIKSEGVTCSELKSSVQKYKPPKKQGNKHRDPPSVVESRHSDRRKKCDFCVYACNRPEHLTRHVKARHNDRPTPHTCVFPDCIDKKTGERRIILERNDNYKAHFTKTHFTYGSTEKSGKNRRKSMKVSLENGLRGDDWRWTKFLANKMTMDHDSKGAWKMIGYSIRETSEIKVKDIVPEWQGPDDDRLEKFDVRWKELKKGTMTYEQAMSVGTDMAETPEQGLLGITMAETKAMGIEHLDVRWSVLESGKMSIEDSEILGVKDLNLRARRKRRYDE